MKKTIITRKEAKKQNLPTYFTGNPCPNGKKSERNTSNGNCLCAACNAHRAAVRRSSRAAAKAKKGGEA